MHGLILELTISILKDKWSFSLRVLIIKVKELFSFTEML
jgi:hypothetical protein